MSVTLLETTPAHDVPSPVAAPAMTAGPERSAAPPHPWVAVRVGCCALCPEAASTTLAAAAPARTRAGELPRRLRVSVSR